MADSKVNIKITSDASQAKREISGFQKSFTEFNAKIDTARMALETFTGVFAKALEIGKQGAQLERTREQFDRLSVSIGTTSESLLEGLGKATRGMMSNAEMISSATQIISLGLADNETDVIRLASVVSELGWDMQQVILTFANNSTMRLDALGLSVENVTTKAKALEEQGFSADKAFDLAVLEAAEEKIGLVGSAADTSVGSFARFEASTKNLADELKLRLLPPLTDAAEAATLLITWSDQIAEAFADQSHNVARAADSYEEYRKEVLRAAVAAGYINQNTADFIETQVAANDEVATAYSRLNLLTEAQWVNYQRVEALKEIYDAAGVTTREWTDSMWTATDTTELFGLAAIHAQDSIAGMPQTLSNIRSAAEEAAPEIMTFAEAMDAAAKGRPSAIEKLREDLEWLASGGADIGGTVAKIEQALDDGLDPAAVGDATGLALLSSLLLSVENGDTTLSEAKKSLMESLNISLADATDMFNEYENYAEALEAAERELNWQIVLDQQSQEILNSLTAVLGVDSHTVNISLVGQTRGAQSFSGTSVGWDPTGPGGHFGTDFVVPSGHNNDGFPMRVESGERVTVTPASEVASGRGGMGAPSQVIVMLDGEQIAARVMTKAGRDYRTTRANGGGYTGR